MKYLSILFLFLTSNLLASGPYNGYVYVNVTNHINSNGKPFIIVNVSTCDNDEGEEENTDYSVESREHFIFRHNKVFMNIIVPYYKEYGTLSEWYPSNKVSSQLYPIPNYKHLNKETNDEILSLLEYLLNDDYKVRETGYIKLLKHRNNIPSFQRPNHLTPEQHMVLDRIIRENEVISPYILRELRKDIFFLALCYHNATKENKVNIVNEIVSKFYELR